MRIRWIFDAQQGGLRQSDMNIVAETNNVEREEARIRAIELSEWYTRAGQLPSRAR